MTNTKNSAYRQIHKPLVVLFICASSLSTQAALLSDSSERRIQIRQGNNTDSINAYISASTNASNHSPGVTMLSGANTGDSMQGLIAQKQRDFTPNSNISIQESKQVNINRRTPVYSTTYNKYSTANNTYNSTNSDSSNISFNAWLNSNSYRAQQVAEYQRYLTTRVGARNVPPLSQLLTTARSWDKCGYEPYQLPPQELWANIVPTLRLYTELKNQGIIPATSEIRSVYRSPGLNNCAGGADSSKHMNGSAMDIWVPEYEDNLWQRSTMQDGLCQFWQYQGKEHNFGLGLYATGAIHLDTDGYRKWGFNHASSSSSCRY
ncbi:D-Ala-D-Ala carboxypeptidase family metallohydrolase [Psychrobacter alimentarius]|uniref:D-Ala-D-Ala carboxypeptidase family metallohydrolase n=1 Tax=Psychrobacter alimentarius TaxID=261164 RepID=UPI00191980DE|nr:D-Ala-D-Ala carboxypeptidase family metallohydrolase [Psychrobacter alimentarius]